MPLRVLIVDDEPLARMRLAALLRDNPQPRCEVVGEAADATQALAWLGGAGTPPACDAVLLDIQMPGLTGTRLAAQLRLRGTPPAVVFVTAHAEHALQAFDLEAVDYLTKPVRRERLQQAMERVAQRLATQVQAAPAADDVTLVVSDRGRVLRVPLAEVLYLKAELKYVSLRTAQRTLLLDESLVELEPRLGDRFIRLHRNTLAARKALRALQRRPMAAGDDGRLAETWAVQVQPVDEWLAVSRRQLSAVREALSGGGV